SIRRRVARDGDPDEIRRALHAAAVLEDPAAVVACDVPADGGVRDLEPHASVADAPTVLGAVALDRAVDDRHDRAEESMDSATAAKAPSHAPRDRAALDRETPSGARVDPSTVFQRRAITDDDIPKNELR